MTDTRSIIKYDNLELASTKLIIQPFGDSFILNTKSQILVISDKGNIVNKYVIPNEWIDATYQVFSYIK